MADTEENSSSTNEAEYIRTMKKLGLVSLLLLGLDVLQLIFKPITTSTILFIIIEWLLVICGFIYCHRFYKGRRK
ncbi:hypothetical protein [Scatolibacter rhodanostii]|uniref:hypothetical protein n=1 Tax=Scatolibacter rhodanostii TaxID=2014781 RepID=UPI000C08005B|nr:hypothetical protein [Scatolibacter rhodanostii]